MTEPLAKRLLRVVALFVLVPAVGWFAGVPAASAQENEDRAGDANTSTESVDSADESTDVTPGSTVPFAFPEAEREWKVRLAPASDSESVEWRLEILRPDGSKAVQTAVPNWAAPPEYRIRAGAARVGEPVVVLAEIYPDKLEASPASVHLQLAWRVDEPDKTAGWTMIGRLQHSDLEGGDVYEIGERQKRRKTGKTGKTEKTEKTNDEAPARLIRRSTDAATTFCGRTRKGGAAYHRYMPDTGRFVRMLDIDELIASAKPLKAELPQDPLEGPFTRGAYQWYWATSEVGAGEDSDIVRPMALGDRRASTAWTVDAAERLRGEYATGNITTALPVTSLRILPGRPQSKQSWEAYGRPTRMLVSLANGRTFEVEIPEVDYATLVNRRGLTIDLPEPIRTHCITIVHLEGQPPADEGRGARPVAIAEFTPITVVDASTPRQTAENLVERIAEEPDLRRRKRMAYIASTLTPHLTAAVEEALEKTSGVERRRIIPLLRHLPADRAVERLVEYFKLLEREAVEYRPVKRALAAQGTRAAEAIVEMLPTYDANDPKYVDLVRLLGRLGGADHLETLIQDLGQGGQTARNERVRAIASAGRPMLVPLLQSINAKNPGAATRDALKAIHLVGKRVQGRITDPPAGASVLAKVLRETDDRRTLMLTLRALKSVHVDGTTKVIEERLMDYSDPLVRSAAMETLGYIPTPKARALLERGLKDASPDVRIHAVTSFDNRRDVEQSVSALLEHAKREDWEPALRQSLAVLARLETPETTEFFVRTLRSRREEPVAMLAASALVRADRPMPFALVRELALDDTISDQLRVEMIDLMGLGEDPRGERFLLMLTDPARLAREVSDPQVRLAFERRALLSLGRRRSAAARSRLFKMAQTGSDMKLRQHALRALAFYEGEDLLRKLKAWKSKAPPQLRGTIQQTIRIIENRAAVEEVSQQLEDTMEAERKSQENQQNQQNQQSLEPSEDGEDPPSR